MLAFPNAAYASLEAGAIPHRVIESGTAEAKSRNDREERTFRSPAVAASKIQLRHVRTMQRVEAVWDTAMILVHKAVEHGAEHGTREEWGTKGDMLHDLRFQTPLVGPPFKTRTETPAGKRANRMEQELEQEGAVRWRSVGLP
jgi:hypothetical protein